MTNKVSSNSSVLTSSKKSKVFYIYRITNFLNNKTYIGQHSYFFERGTNDNYMGSGVALKEAINKYGIKNFKKEILIEGIESKQEADNIEKDLIKKERDTRGKRNVYNEADGGQGGNLGEEVNKKISKKALELWKDNEERKESLSKKFKGISHRDLYGPNYVNSFYGKHHTEESKQKMRESHSKIDYTGENNAFYGKHHTDESKQKIRESKLGKSLGHWTEEHRVKTSRTLIAKRNLFLKKKSEGSYTGSWNDFQKEYNIVNNPSLRKELELY